MILLRYVTYIIFDVRGWMRRNGFLVVDSWRGVAEAAIRVFVVGSGCGQEEPGIIMRVNLATGSTVQCTPCNKELSSLLKFMHQ